MKRYTSKTPINSTSNSIYACITKFHYHTLNLLVSINLFITNNFSIVLKPTKTKSISLPNSTFYNRPFALNFLKMNEQNTRIGKYLYIVAPVRPTLSPKFSPKILRVSMTTSTPFKIWNSSSFSSLYCHSQKCYITAYKTDLKNFKT